VTSRKNEIVAHSTRPPRNRFIGLYYRSIFSGSASLVARVKPVVS